MKRLSIVLAAIAILGVAVGIAEEPTVKITDAEQSELNESLRVRNAALDAEVVNLKQGRDAAEERARTDLGMIGKQETFYQVVPVASTSH